MLEKIYLIAFICLVSFSSQEQGGASIVYDPTNGAQLASVLTTMKDLKKLNEEWKSSAEFLNKIVKQGKEVKRLISLLEGIVCATDEMSLYVGLTSELSICENKIKMDMSLAKIEGVSENLKWIVSGTIVLSQYESITSLKSLNDELEEAIESTISLNAFLRRAFEKSIENEYDSQEGYKNVSLLTPMNI
jgi:hypothetical protein